MTIKKESLTDKVLNSPETAKVFYYILSEELNYAQAIAEKINKKPEGVLNHLKKLKKVGLLHSRKEKLLNKTVYLVKSEKLGELFLLALSEDTIPEFNKNKLLNANVSPLFENLFVQQVIIEYANMLLNADISIRTFFTSLASVCSKIQPKDIDQLIKNLYAKNHSAVENKILTEYLAGKRKKIQPHHQDLIDKYIRLSDNLENTQDFVNICSEYVNHRLFYNVEDLVENVVTRIINSN